MRIVWLLLGSMAVQSCSSKPVDFKSEPNQYRLFILTSLRGELEPCGCSLEPLGGLARLATYLQNRKQKGITPLLIAHGDLVSPGKVSKGSLPQIQEAGRFLQRQLINLGIVISGTGQADDQLEGLRSIEGMPWIDPNDFKTLQGVQFLRGNSAQPINPKRPAILLFDGSLEDATKQAQQLKTRGIDLVIVSQPHEEPAISKLAPGLFALIGGERGQQLLDIDMTWHGDQLVRLEGAGERQLALDAMQTRISGLIKQRDRAKVRQKSTALIKARTAQVERAKAQRSQLLQTPLPKAPANVSSLSGQRVPLDSNIAEDASMTQAIQQHHQAISQLNKKLEKTRECAPPADPKSAQYIGNLACRGCHPQAYDLWKKTPHAKAWSTLEKKGRTYDYTCIGCHSAGFDEPGGFCRVSEAGDRINVGCESCHGPGSLHVAQAGLGPIKRKVSADGCTQCHHPPHTNTFVYKDRLHRILGPGHMAKP